MTKTIRELEEDLEKLKKCCEWNGWNYKTTPAYKSIMEEYEKKNKEDNNKK